MMMIRSKVSRSEVVRKSTNHNRGSGSSSSHFFSNEKGLQQSFSSTLTLSFSSSIIRQRIPLQYLCHPLPRSLPLPLRHQNSRIPKPESHDHYDPLMYSIFNNHKLLSSTTTCTNISIHNTTTTTNRSYYQTAIINDNNINNNNSTLENEINNPLMIQKSSSSSYKKQTKTINDTQQQQQQQSSSYDDDSYFQNVNHFHVLLSTTTTAFSVSMSNIINDFIHNQLQKIIIQHHSQSERSRKENVNNNNNNNNMNNNDPIEEHSIPTMMCCSYISTTKEKKLSWYQRLIQFLIQLWQKTYHGTVLFIRGSEIIIRFTPFLFLIPASILMEQYLLLRLPQRTITTTHCTNTGSGDNNNDDEEEDAKYEYAPIRRLQTNMKSGKKLLNDSSNQRTVATKPKPVVVVVRNHLYDTKNGISNMSWNYLTYTVSALGPAFIKLCQWIATRRDIFPPNVCNRLSHLHDHGICHDWSYTQQILINSFGSNYKELGLLIEEEMEHSGGGTIIGCGSAAQVYKGTLQIKKMDPSTNVCTMISKPVAIKVLHPKFQYYVERDLYLLQSVATMIHALPIEMIRMLNLPKVAHNFGMILQLQSDLRVEAKNLNEFRLNFYGTNKKKNKKQKQTSNNEDDNEDDDTIHVHSSIVFPKPINNWVSKDVLVEELIENAVPISDYLTDCTTNEDHTITSSIRRELAIPLLNAFLKMIFLDNFVHCDLHPGNVLVRKYYVKREKPLDWIWNTINQTTTNEVNSTNNFLDDAKDPNMVLKRQIVFLDAGIAFQLDQEAKQNLIDLFRAVVLNNGKEAGRLMVERAKYERCSSTPGGIEAFSNGIDGIVSEFHDRRRDGLTLGAVRIGSLLTRVLDLCRVHGVEIDPAMASVIISTLVLEGLGRSLEPSLNLIDFALPFVLGRGKI